MADELADRLEEYARRLRALDGKASADMDEAAKRLREAVAAQRVLQPPVVPAVPVLPSHVAVENISKGDYVVILERLVRKATEKECLPFAIAMGFESAVAEYVAEINATERVEELGPVGVLPSQEAVTATLGPEPMHEAAALVEGIRKIAARGSST